MTREVRFFPHAELRAKRSGRAIEGYAAIFNAESDPLLGFTEIVRRGCFAESLQKYPDVRALYNHDANLLLGRVKSKTLRVAEDSRGLHFDCDVPDTQFARDLMASIERGDIDGCSFSFACEPDGQRWSGETRELLKVHLFDLGPVTFPAYQGTTVDARMNFPEGLPREIQARGLLIGGQRGTARNANARCRLRLAEAELPLGHRNLNPRRWLRLAEAELDAEVWHGAAATRNARSRLRLAEVA